MSKVIDAKYENDITFVLDYLVESSVYNPWKEKLTNQLLKNVEVPGFRKGKAPQHLLQQQVNHTALQETVLRETLEKYGVEAAQEINKHLEKDERSLQNLEVSLNPEHTLETDSGFQFRLVASLLPQVNLENLETIEIPEPSPDTLKNRASLADFTKQETARLLISYNQYQDTDEKAKDQYQITCDLTGVINNKPEPKLTSNDVVITLGGGDFLPDFEKGVTGVKLARQKVLM
jgi:trigger factor